VFCKNAMDSEDDQTLCGRAAMTAEQVAALPAVRPSMFDESPQQRARAARRDGSKGFEMPPWGVLVAGAGALLILLSLARSCLF